MPHKQSAKARSQQVSAEAARSSAAPAPEERIWLLRFLERRAGIAALALVLLGSLRIVSTYPVFSHTFDEPNHIADGMEWLEKGTYTIEPQHPPLARAAAALGPYLLGIRLPSYKVTLANAGLAGLDMLFSGNRYERNLSAARFGILPFFWIACAAVYFWAKREYGRPAAVFSTLLFSFIPTILAHAGLATTDMAVTAFAGAAFTASLAWFEAPGCKSSLLFGATTGLAVVSKLSALVFLPAAWGLCLGIYLAQARPGLQQLTRDAHRRLTFFLLAVATGFLAIWAVYRFSFDKVPMPELWAGIKQVEQHNSEGHLSYLLGHTSVMGFWDYFPVALAVKTPLGLLLMLPFATPLIFRRSRRAPRLWIPAVFSGAILAVGMSSHINIGVRHILPIFFGMAMLGGVTLADAFHNFRVKPVAAYLLTGLTLWTLASSLVHHPDYLAYFNELAGSHPENILVDSDLDWGQDLLRLRDRLRELRVDRVAFTPASSSGIERMGFPPHTENDPKAPSAGWNAVSVSEWKLENLEWPGRFDPTERVGRSILLYYFKPGDPALIPANPLRDVLRELNQRK